MACFSMRQSVLTRHTHPVLACFFYLKESKMNLVNINTKETITTLQLRDPPPEEG